MYGDPSEPDPSVRGIEREMPHYSREWSFDPYHQSLGLARRRAPEQSEADTEWPVWEVFQQAKRGEHHKHVGSLHAPDAEFALVLAKENFARRGACVNLWVAPAHCIFATDYEDADIFEHTTDRMYREPGGFHGLRKNLRRASQAAQAAAEAEDDDHVEGVLKAGADIERERKAAQAEVEA